VNVDNSNEVDTDNCGL